MTEPTSRPGAHLEVVPTPPASSVPAATPGGMPTPAEFGLIQQMADILASSDLVPAAYRRKPANVILATLAGRPFGWDPTMAMRSFHVIEGVPSMKPEVMLALIRRAGHSVTGTTSPTGATVTGTRCDTGDTMNFTFDQTAAQAAGLLNKAVWKQYAPSMYWARALAQLARMLFPDVVLGAGYTPEELGARISDDDVIDVSEVDGVHVQAPLPPTVTEAAVKNRLVDLAEGDTGRARELWLTRPAHLRPDGEAWAGTDPSNRGLLLFEPVEQWITSLDQSDGDVVDAEIVRDGTNTEPGDAA